MLVRNVAKCFDSLEKPYILQVPPCLQAEDLFEEISDLFYARRNLLVHTALLLLVSVCS